MTLLSDFDYYLKREVEERAAAVAAIDPAARRIHLNLADRYAERAHMATARPPWSGNDKSKGPALS